MKIIDEFYDNLFKDYKLYEQESIIYMRYHRDLLSSAERYYDCQDLDDIDPSLKLPRPSISDRILWAYHKWVKNPGSDKRGGVYEYFYFVLPILIKNHKTYSYVDRNREGQGIDEIREVFAPFFRGLIDIDKSARKSFFRDHLPELLSEDAKRRLKENIDPKSVQNLHDHLISRIICKSYDDYLYNAGYDCKTEKMSEREDEKSACLKSHESRDAKKKDMTKKKDITIELMMDYYHRYGYLPISCNNTEDDIYIGTCKDVLERLLRQKYDKNNPISIPVFSDCVSGCSLRIISRQYYPYQIDGLANYSFAVFSPEFVDGGEYGQHFYTYYSVGDKPDIFTLEQFDGAKECYERCVKEASDEYVTSISDYISDYSDKSEKNKPTNEERKEIVLECEERKKTMKERGKREFC